MPARAQTGRGDAAEFKALMRKGIAEYRAGNLEDARQALARAWSLRRENELAATLAEVEMKLGRFRDAAEHWEHYIDALPPDRTEAEQRLSECRRRLGSVRVAADPDGAAVLVDGKEVGRAPLKEDLWVEPGDHTFELRFDGRVSPLKRSSIAAGDAVVVALSLGAPRAPEPPSPSGPAAPVSAASARSGTGAAEVDSGSGGLSASSIVLVAGSVLTATATGLGIGFTLKGNAADEDVTGLREKIAKQPGAADRSYCSPPAGTAAPDECRDLVTKLDERDQSRRIALGSFIGAGVLGVGTIVTFLAWPSSTHASNGAGGARVSVAPFRQGTGASLRVTF